MFCRRCGTENKENNKSCKKCGEALLPIEENNYTEEAKKIPNYLTLAIIVTVLCFWPTGIMAIVYASRVNTLLVAGKYDDAKEASKKAKKWSIVSILVMLIVILIFIPLIFFSGN